MGLRLVAHYFDPVDALIAQSVIDAAGVLSFLHGSDLLTIQPYYVMGMGGFRLVVSEDDLAIAVAVLDEARANPLARRRSLLVKSDSR